MNRIVFHVMITTLFTMTPVVANNLQVQNAVLINQNTTSDHTHVQFDISWDNSWRDIVNWDAAWVFVKYKGGDGLWKHATLSTNNGDHTAPSGSVINASSDGKGIFIYRNAVGSGSNIWTTVQLRWTYGTDGLADNALVTVKVFAIEMVYVPQGSFYAGDGAATNRFYDADQGSAFPFYITSQGSLNFASSGSGNIWTTGTSMTTGTSHASYPTGFNAFYSMKYEVSQEQYVDFLNTLTRTQQNNRTATDLSIGTTSVTNVFVMSNTSSASNRNGIRCASSISGTGPITFFCDLNSNGTANESADGQNIACNFLAWTDGSAYADWSALRPMTEFEFEKAARGSDLGVVPAEFAWGSTSIHGSTYSLSASGAANETITSQPTGTGNASYFTTDGSLNGPLRCGLFALTGTNRMESGASYYGIMEMSGNLRELCVGSYVAAAIAYTGNHGDGLLSTNGNANPSTWLGLSSGEVTSSNDITGRGGDWNDTQVEMQVSSRSYYDMDGWTTSQSNFVGFRLVRTAP